MTRTMSAFGKWAMACEVPGLGWAALEEPTAEDLQVRYDTLVSASGRRELCDDALCQLLVHLGVLNSLEF